MKGWCSTLEKIINDADGVLDNFHLPQKRFDSKIDSNFQR